MSLFYFDKSNQNEWIRSIILVLVKAQCITCMLFVVLKEEEIFIYLCSPSPSQTWHCNLANHQPVDCFSWPLLTFLTWLSTGINLRHFFPPLTGESCLVKVDQFGSGPAGLTQSSLTDVGASGSVHDELGAPADLLSKQTNISVPR